MVNPPFNIPLNQIVSVGIYPRQKWRQMGKWRQAFGIPGRCERDWVKTQLVWYLRETREARSIRFFESKNENEVIVEWQE